MEVKEMYLSDLVVETDFFKPKKKLIVVVEFNPEQAQDLRAIKGKEQLADDLAQQVKETFLKSAGLPYYDSSASKYSIKVTKSNEGFGFYKIPLSE